MKVREVFENINTLVNADILSAFAETNLGYHNGTEAHKCLAEVTTKLEDMLEENADIEVDELEDEEVQDFLIKFNNIQWNSIFIY